MGAVLKNLTSVCGATYQFGTEVDAYITCSCELTGAPATIADGGGTAEGDTKILDEPWDFTAAPTGEGYWRHFRILIDTGRLKAAIEGDVGAQGFKNSVEFFVPGNQAAQMEFADNFVGSSGYVVMMIRIPGYHMAVIGSRARPAKVETLEIDGGAILTDRVGGAYLVSATGKKSYDFYDDATHGIDLTPNP